MSLRTSLLRTSPLRATPSLSRSLHHRIPLPYQLDQGLPGFLSPKALETIAVDWQQGVLNRLNDLVRSQSNSLSLLPLNLFKSLSILTLRLGQIRMLKV